MQDNKVMMDWLHRRKISDTVISEFNIHWGEHPTIGECIVIPIKEGFNKYRRNPLSHDTPKYVYDKGGRLALYGSDRIALSKTVLITEGEMDALVAWSANIPAVSGTGGAMSFDPTWADILKDKEVTICFDNDSAGGEGMVKALSIIPWAKIVFIPDRPGVKDISDYVANGGDLHALLGTAKGYGGLDEVISDRSERLATWKSVFFHDAYIKMHTKPTYAPRAKSKEVGDKVARAKEYPIHEMIDFNMQGKARCLWHNEKTASMTYYPKTNSVYCFGCSKHGDAIDVYMKVHGVKFVDAIKKMI